MAQTGTKASVIESQEEGGFEKKEHINTGRLTGHREEH